MNNVATVARAASTCISPTGITTVDPNTGEPSTVPNAATVETIDTADVQATFRIPPSTWQPLSATSAELAFYGLPARPTDPVELADWTSEWSNYSGFTTSPQICPMDDATSTLQPTAPVSGGPGPLVLAGHIPSPEWSGLVATRGSYYEVYGQTYAPTRSTYCNGAVHVNWVGLGGWNGDQKLAQNGIDDRYSTPALHIWYELLNATQDTGEVWMATNLGVRQGDKYSLSTTYHSYDPPTTTHSYFSFGWHNWRTGEVTGVNVSTVNGTSIEQFFSDATAEAIDERPRRLSDGKLYALEPFNPSKWDTAKVYRDGSSYLMRSDTHSWLDMVNKAGTLTLANSEIVSGSNSAQFQDHWHYCGTVE